MKILGIEATGNHCSIALLNDEAEYQKTLEAPQKQGAIILPMIEEVLTDARIQPGDLDVVAFNNGPGSFTGVRLTISVAQGLALGWRKPVMPVSSLQALAYKAYCEHASKDPIWVMIDARKQEVYAAAYRFEACSVEIIYPEQVIAPEHLPVKLISLSPVPAAADIAYLAKWQLQCGLVPLFPEEIQPTYLRNKVTD